MFKISRFRLVGYSSFADTGWIELSPGFNLIVGQNNVGKSALISAFGTLPDNRHLSPTEVRRDRLPLPWFDTDVHISGETLEDAMLHRGGDYHFPVAGNPREVGDFFSTPDVEFQLTRRASHAARSRRYPSHGLFDGSGGGGGGAVVLGVQDGVLQKTGEVGGSADTLVESAMDTAWNENVFVFDAQRKIGRYGNTPAPRVASDASNLAAFLFRIQGQNVSTFRRIERHMQDIFPTVRGVTVAPTDQANELEIRVWPTVEQELGFPLNDSGTGVAQVLAILTVALTMTEAVLVIDEISSHLHPAAAKTLVRILRTEYSSHQYLVSTHSAEIIASAQPDRVLLVRKSGYDSSIGPIDLDNIERLQDVTTELGISLSDVFAAERIVWVEGLTEELSFPLALEVSGTSPPPGLTFVSVISTGELLGTKREQVLRIYRRLTQAASGLVPEVAFSFDREDLTETQIADLEREGTGRVHFLPRRNLEAYLISPEAVAALINEKVPDLVPKLSAEQARAKMIEVGGQQDLKAAEDWTGDLNHGPWLAKVDGARLLKRVIAELTNNRFEFGKGRHSAALLKYELEHHPDRARELVEYVRGLAG